MHFTDPLPAIVIVLLLLRVNKLNFNEMQFSVFSILLVKQICNLYEFTKLYVPLFN